jgi:DNA-binding NarL/FixJ family response regulator
MKQPRVLLADDHTLLLEAFRTLLEPRYDVVGTVSDGRALLKSASLLKPDVVLMDISMPLLNGLEAARQLKQKTPGIKIIFLTMNEDSDFAVEAMRAGASGYLLKTSAQSELFHAIQEVLLGRPYVTPKIAREMQESFSRDPRFKAKALTPRQREVIQLLGEGKTCKEVGRILGMAERTAYFHKYRMMEQMGFKSNADLIRFALKNDIIAA